MVIAKGLGLEATERVGLGHVAIDQYLQHRSWVISRVICVGRLGIESQTEGVQLVKEDID